MEYKEVPYTVPYARKKTISCKSSIFYNYSSKLVQFISNRSGPCTPAVPPECYGTMLRKTNVSSISTLRLLLFSPSQGHASAWSSGRISEAPCRWRSVRRCHFAKSAFATSPGIEMYFFVVVSNSCNAAVTSSFNLCRLKLRFFFTDGNCNYSTSLWYGNTATKALGDLFTFSLRSLHISRLNGFLKLNFPFRSAMLQLIYQGPGVRLQVTPKHCRFPTSSGRAGTFSSS